MPTLPLAYIIHLPLFVDLSSSDPPSVCRPSFPASQATCVFIISLCVLHQVLHAPVPNNECCHLHAKAGFIFFDAAKYPPCLSIFSWPAGPVQHLLPSSVSVENVLACDQYLPAPSPAMTCLSTFSKTRMVNSPVTAGSDWQ